MHGLGLACSCIVLGKWAASLWPFPLLVWAVYFYFLNTQPVGQHSLCKASHVQASLQCFLEFSKPGSFTSLRGYSWTSSSSSSVGIARLGSCFSPSAVAAATPGPFPPLQSLAHTGFATSVLEFAKLDSLVLPQQPGCVGLTYSLHGLERIGSVSLLSVANLGCLDLPVLVRSVCRLGLAVPALGFSHLEPLVLSRRFGCLGLTLLTSGASTMGFRLIASDRTCLGSSVPMRSYARAEPAALASNLSEPDTVLPLRGLSCLEALTPPSGLS